MTESRVWYRREKLEIDKLGMTPPIEMKGTVQKIVSETLDIHNGCVWVLIRYQVWEDKKKKEVK